jgi:hypothetical protein
MSNSVYIDGEFYEVFEDASMVKKRKKKKRPDPKRSRAAKKAAKDPKTKAARKKGAKKFHKSAKGKAFHKKLGRFNAKRSTLKASRNLPMALQVIKEFMAADLPEEWIKRAQAMLNVCSEGPVDVNQVIDEIDRLAEDVEAAFAEEAVEEADTVNMYALYIGDGYLAGATTDDGGDEERFWPMEMRENDDWGIVELDRVPVDLAQQLEVQGTSDQVFRDGYDAANAAANYAGDLVDSGEAYRE